MSMEYFFIEYAKMRQKEIELEVNAIRAARLARSKRLNSLYSEVLGKLGNLLVRWGQKRKKHNKQVVINHDDEDRCCLPNKIWRSDYENIGDVLQSDGKYGKGCCCHSCGSFAGQ